MNTEIHETGPAVCSMDWIRPCRSNQSFKVW